MIRLYRIAPEGLYAATDPATDEVRVLYSDPFETWPGGWEYGRRIDLESASFLAPVAPSKIIGIGRNYRDHARELGNPMPTEPMYFLKAPSALSGPRAPIVLPPESEQVEFEGEVALVLRHRLRRATPEEARTAILGVMPACDVTARDIQKKDGRFARAKGFDTFCPVGPAIGIDSSFDSNWDDLSVVTRVNGAERQRGACRDMAFGFVEVLVYLSRMMTLEPGDVVLTGTPAGVGTLADGDVVEVEIPGVGVLVNPVEAWRADEAG